MAIRRNANGGIAQGLRTLFDVGTIGGLTDGQLLEWFTTREREAAELAFSALVERHGPMVLRVCRRAIADPHEAQDAFQATFLVLVRKAGAVRRRESVASWLHGVAVRVAAYARKSADRRKRLELRAASLAAVGPWSRLTPTSARYCTRSCRGCRNGCGSRSCSVTSRARAARRPRGGSGGRWGR